MIVAVAEARTSPTGAERDASLVIVRRDAVCVIAADGGAHVEGVIMTSESDVMMTPPKPVFPLELRPAGSRPVSTGRADR